MIGVRSPRIGDPILPFAIESVREDLKTQLCRQLSETASQGGLDRLVALRDGLELPAVAVLGVGNAILACVPGMVVVMASDADVSPYLVTTKLKLLPGVQCRVSEAYQVSEIC